MIGIQLSWYIRGKRQYKLGACVVYSIRTIDAELRLLGLLHVEYHTIPYKTYKVHVYID